MNVQTGCEIYGMEITMKGNMFGEGKRRDVICPGGKMIGRNMSGSSK